MGRRTHVVFLEEIYQSKRMDGIFGGSGVWQVEKKRWWPTCSGVVIKVILDSYGTLLTDWWVRMKNPWILKAVICVHADDCNDGQFCDEREFHGKEEKNSDFRLWAQLIHMLPMLFVLIYYFFGEELNFIQKKGFWSFAKEARMLNSFLRRKMKSAHRGILYLHKQASLQICSSWKANK